MDLLEPGVKSVKRGGIPISSLGLLGQIGLYKAITVGFVVCMIAIFSISASSIGMQCMNSNGDYKGKHKSGYNFMIFSLILSILLLILGIVIIVARIMAV